MAYSSIRTLIPLNNAAKVLQIDPLHFDGVYSDLRPVRNNCDDVWSQHDWQATGRASRESLVFALKQAEDQVTEVLGYSPAPTWVVEEEHRLTKPESPELRFTTLRNARGQSSSIISDYGYVIEGGRRATSVISLGVAVAFSDPDGDLYDELATVTVATTLTDIEEIGVFYPGKSGVEEFEIRPVTISTAAGVATITFPKHMIPLEDLVETLVGPNVGLNIRAIDGDVNANFLQTVDVYRVYNDPSQQAIFSTENGCSSCYGTGCVVCGDTTETACLYTRDERLGILTYARADWDSDTLAFTQAGFTTGRMPDKLKIWYRAGRQNKKLTTPKLTMDTVWERMIVFYALTFLDTDVGWCDNTKRIYAYQLESLDKSAAGKSYTVSDRLLNNPLGQTRAAINLWQRITGPGGRLVKAR